MFEPSMILYFLLFGGVFALDISVFHIFGGGEEVSQDAGQYQDGPAEPDDAVSAGSTFAAQDHGGRVDDPEPSASVLEADDEINLADFLTGGDEIVITTRGGDVVVTTDAHDFAAGGAGDGTLPVDADDDLVSTDPLDGSSSMTSGSDAAAGDDGRQNIFLGDADEASEGVAAETYTVFEIESPEAPPARITDFDPAEDRLHIQYCAQDDPETGDPIAPELTVGYDADADMTSVSIFGAAIATLAGRAGITAADVTLSEIT